MENRKITSPADLSRIHREIISSDEYRKEKVYVCAGGGCIASGSMKVKKVIEDSIKANKLEGRVSVVETGCLGPCALGPVVVVGKDDTFYQNVREEDAAAIVTGHLMAGRKVEKCLVVEENKQTPSLKDIGFFKRQKKIVLRNCGKINPNRIEDYIGINGYQAAVKALTTMTPDAIIDEVTKSGLRGRGGAGFPTGKKWSFARKSDGAVKYILCNADEGDPGAFMDRSILEGDPHSLIEGMIIGGFAIGAKEGFVYVRAEYPLAVERLQRAIDQAYAMGILGENIFGTDVSFSLEIRMGSGAFVCGEETALMASIEGRRGEPRPRPPFPAQKGLWDKPTVLNNVETFANIAEIILKGGAWYASNGTQATSGTKIFALAGAVNISGLVEVPVGSTLRELVFNIGGGILKNKKFKAAQIGGPSGGCIPEKHLDVQLDYESLTQLGAIMGSGGLIVMDETSCMVDVARFFLDFVQDESCGKCVPCREGTYRMLEILDRICSGKGVPEDIDLLGELAGKIKSTSLCGLGQTAPNPVLSTLRHFKEEYLEHINEKKCRAAVCKALIVFEITDACTGCAACKRVCPVKCISGTPKNRHVIDSKTCIRCGLCHTTCKFNAITRH